MHTAIAEQTAPNTGAGTQGKKRQDFLIAYPAQAKKDLAEAVNALYYLPHYYKLVVTDASWQNNANQDELRQSVHDDMLMGRVSFDTEAGMSDRLSPFSFADVVLRGREQDDFTSTVKRQIDLTESDSPEALASAILRAARA